MRRVLVVLALSAVALGVMAGPAAAHPGIENPYVPARVATTLALGVASESPSPMVEVDVTLPADFTLQHVDSLPGWQNETTAGGVRFFGGDVPQGGFAQFTFRGVFAAKRVAELPVTTRAADGSSVTWDQAPGGPRPAAVALPGYPIGASVPGVTSAGAAAGGTPVTELVGAALGLVALSALVVVASRRRRATSAAAPAAPRAAVVE